MTTFRNILVVLALAAVTPFAHATPPSELTGLFVSLDGNRLEFPDASTGQDGTENFNHVYSADDSTTASLDLTYISINRTREITLSFDSLGDPAGYTEIDTGATDPPQPPLFRSGTFTIGALDTTIDSSAPGELAGSFVSWGDERHEFLTATVGRVFEPGSADPFSYAYTVLDGTSAGIEIAFDDGVRTKTVTLVFDADGNPVSVEVVEFENSVEVDRFSGEFALGINRNLIDLLIGAASDDLIGDDFYHAPGRHQFLRTRAAEGREHTYYAVVENDGMEDIARLQGTRGRRKLDIGYFDGLSGENITAAVVSGLYLTPTMSHGERRPIEIKVVSDRPRGAYVIQLIGASTTVSGAQDIVLSKTLMRGAPRARGRGQSRARGQQSRARSQSRARGQSRARSQQSRARGQSRGGGPQSRDRSRTP